MPFPIDDKEYLKTKLKLLENRPGLEIKTTYWNKIEETTYIQMFIFDKAPFKIVDS